jgi:ferredoxin, 2Fe-2S
MPTIVFIEHNGEKREVQAEAGRSVMQAAVENAVPGIVADCGGSCSCGTCHGFIDPAWLEMIPPAGTAEAAMLEGLLELKANSRLTCQIAVTADIDGMIVRLPKSQF